MRRDLVDHRDILILTVNTPEGPVNLMNVYSDEKHTAVSLLREGQAELPGFHLMAGDFNCHSEIWDPAVSYHRRDAETLLEVAESLGMAWMKPSNHDDTHIPHAAELSGSVIDLVFAVPDYNERNVPTLVHAHHGRSDHVPISVEIPFREASIRITCMVLPKGSNEEKEFLADVTASFRVVLREDPNTPEQIEALSQLIANVFSSAWDANAKEATITSRSKPWWDEECAKTLSSYRNTKHISDWKSFRKAVKLAKRKFFDDKIEEIAVTNGRPWDLTEWVKQRKLPPCEAIQYDGKPCHELPSLWEALHGTYNAASGRECDASILGVLDPLPEREWARFSHRELGDALRACSSPSAPGPDHITWSHLKMVLSDVKASVVVLTLADACLRVGYWPRHFKESVSVIIPKPGKPSYSTPKSFRPIVLLNTLGKLIEKMISTRLQFDGVKFGLFHPNQFGGIRQRSTEDAGLFLTHLVRTGWAQGLRTSVVAFDIAQFFPSLNHDMLMAILSRQGFSGNVRKFFASYLVGRETKYLWNSFSLDAMAADVGVGQGSALSPVLSALYLAPVIRLFERQASHLKCDVMSYVDDGTLIVQAQDWASNLERLRKAEGGPQEQAVPFPITHGYSKDKRPCSRRRWATRNLRSPGALRTKRPGE